MSRYTMGRGSRREQASAARTCSRLVRVRAEKKQNYGVCKLPGGLSYRCLKCTKCKHWLTLFAGQVTQTVCPAMGKVCHPSPTASHRFLSSRPSHSLWSTEYTVRSQAVDPIVQVMLWNQIRTMKVPKPSWGHADDPLSRAVPPPILL